MMLFREGDGLRSHLARAACRAISLRRDRESFRDRRVASRTAAVFLRGLPEEAMAIPG